MKRNTLVLLLAVLGSSNAIAAPAPTPPVPIPANFASSGDDLSAIRALLNNYTEAVSTKNQRLFESLLLSKTIPFSYIPAQSVQAGANLAHYDDFQRSVFSGSPFTQRFIDVHIAQDGNLANVSLVFVNTQQQTESWGWKTIQLVKTTTGWKIASEFFTFH